MTTARRGKGRRDHYTVLGVHHLATPRQITAAYRRLVRELHPDARPGLPAARERLDEVTAAYGILRDPARRAAYDVSRRRTVHGAPGSGSGLPDTTGAPSPATSRASARSPSGAAGAHRAADVRGVSAPLVDLTTVGAALSSVPLRAGPIRVRRIGP